MVFTPTQYRIFRILADGRPHHKDELFACLGDELQPTRNLNDHLSDIRKYLRLRGEDILCVLARSGIHYQYVRLVTSPPADLL